MDDGNLRTQGRLLCRVRRELRYYRGILHDPRTTPATKWLIRAGVAYLMCPIDLVPDFIPLLGQLDDALVAAGLIWLGLKLLPESVRLDVRRRTELDDVPRTTGILEPGLPLVQQ